MRINKIEILNLDILYKTITILQNNDDYKNLLFTNEFNQVLWEGITKNTKVFKTTYKLSEEIKLNKNNFYSKLIDRKL